MGELENYIAELTQYMENSGITISPLPRVVLKKGSSLTSDTLCNTGHYEPVSKTIVLYTANRHPKDILRSYAHELIHHSQNLNGLLNSETMNDAGDPQYAQNSLALRKLEEDAFLRGNMCFRDWTDSKK